MVVVLIAYLHFSHFNCNLTCIGPCFWAPEVLDCKPLKLVSFLWFHFGVIWYVIWHAFIVLVCLLQCNIYSQHVFMFSYCELRLLGLCSECQNTVTMSTVTFILIENIYVAFLCLFFINIILKRFNCIVPPIFLFLISKIHPWSQWNKILEMYDIVCYGFILVC